MVTPRRFPVRATAEEMQLRSSVPYQLVLEHATQMRENHGLDVEAACIAGGLNLRMLAAVLSDRPRWEMDIHEANEVIGRVLNEYDDEWRQRCKHILDVASSAEPAPAGGPLRFPVRGGTVERELRSSLPYQLVLDHEAQMIANHGFGVATAAKAGGMGLVELAAILHDRSWRPMSIAEAEAEIQTILP